MVGEVFSRLQSDEKEKIKRIPLGDGDSYPEGSRGIRRQPPGINRARATVAQDHDVGSTLFQNAKLTPLWV